MLQECVGMSSQNDNRLHLNIIDLSSKFDMLLFVVQRWYSSIPSRLCFDVWLLGPENTRKCVRVTVLEGFKGAYCWIRSKAKDSRTSVRYVQDSKLSKYWHHLDSICDVVCDVT